MSGNDTASGNDMGTGPVTHLTRPDVGVTERRKLDPGVLILLIAGSLIAVTGCILLALADGTEPWTFLYLLPTVAGVLLICAAFGWGAELAARRSA